MRYSTAGRLLSQVNTAYTTARKGYDAATANAALAASVRPVAAGLDIARANTSNCTNPQIGTERTATGHESDTCPVEVEQGIKFDIETGRIAFGLKMSPLLQRYLPLHQLARDTQRQGFSRAEFDAALHRHGVKGCDAYNTRLLRRGDGFWWNIDHRTGMIYPVGYISLCNRLIERAYTLGMSNLYSTNGVGLRKEMFINVAGSTADFEGSVLASWYASKSNPIISRAVLTLLFNRTAHTLRSLEARAGVKVVTNIAHTYDPSLVPLNEFGGWRWDVDTYSDYSGRTVYTFFMSNTYHAPRIRQHHRWGQLPRAAALIDNLIETFELHLSGHETGDKPVKLNPDRSLKYFETAKSAQSNCKKYGDSERYVYLGQDDTRAMFELSRDGRVGLDYWEAVGGINALV